MGAKLDFVWSGFAHRDSSEGPDVEVLAHCFRALSGSYRSCCGNFVVNAPAAMQVMVFKAPTYADKRRCQKCESAMVVQMLQELADLAEDTCETLDAHKNADDAELVEVRMMHLLQYVRAEFPRSK